MSELRDEIEQALRAAGLRHVIGAIDDGADGAVVVWGAMGRDVWSVEEALQVAREIEAGER